MARSTCGATVLVFAVVVVVGAAVVGGVVVVGGAATVNFHVAVPQSPPGLFWSESHARSMAVWSPGAVPAGSTKLILVTNFCSLVNPVAVAFFWMVGVTALPSIVAAGTSGATRLTSDSSL